MYSKVKASTTADQGFCTSADKDCVVINETSGTYSITSFASSITPDALNPTTKAITEATEYGLYGFSSAQWVIPLSTKAFAYRYLRPKDLAYWQVTDPDRVW